MIFYVDNVDNFVEKLLWITKNAYFTRSSPILYTSPAPIVINKSPLIQFSDKNFSISTNDGK